MKKNNLVKSEITKKKFLEYRIYRKGEIEEEHGQELKEERMVKLKKDRRVRRKIDWREEKLEKKKK